MADQGPLSGKTLGGRYELGLRVGSGGFADVYLGEHIHLKAQRAIKVLHTHLADADVEKFREEARFVARLDHPHILKVHDFDLHNGMPFLVMDHAPNGSLRQRHAREKPLPLSTIVSYVKQIADALQYAHDQKVIHRDIKPENLLLGRNNDILLSDFGIAVLAQTASQQPTQGFAGTATYAAPEQIMGKPQQASDQYALGIMVYERLAGAPPFQGAPMEVCFQHVQAPPLSLVQKVPGLAPEVEQVVFTALAKDPQARFKQVRAFATALEQASQSAVTIPVWGAAPTPAPQPSPAAAPTTPAANPPVGPAWAQAGTPTQVDSSSGSPVAPVGNPPPAARSGPPRGTTLVIHESSEVNALAWSPDGRRIASNISWPDERYTSIRMDGIEVWDAFTGRTLRRQGYFGKSHIIFWSPDGKYVGSVAYYSGSYGLQGRRVGIWEWEAKRKASWKFWDSSQKFSEQLEGVEDIFNESSENLSSVAEPAVVLWSPDLSKIAVIAKRSYSENYLRVLSLRDYKPIVQWSIPERKPCNGDAVAWSPDNTRITWGAGNEIPVWDVSSSQKEGHHLLTYREHRSPVAAVSWSPDGRQITSRSEDGFGHVWDAGNGQTISTFTAPTERKKPLVSLVDTIKERSAISPDGILKAVPTNDGIALRTVAGRNETVFVYRGHFSDKTAQNWSPEVKALAWSPDGARIAFARFDGKIYVWQAV